MLHGWVSGSRRVVVGNLQRSKSSRTLLRSDMRGLFIMDRWYVSRFEWYRSGALSSLSRAIVQELGHQAHRAEEDGTGPRLLQPDGTPAGPPSNPSNQRQLCRSEGAPSRRNLCHPPMPGRSSFLLPCTSRDFFRAPL